MSATNEKFDLWCIVELFGHSKIAGKCSEQNIAGTNMLRVDVPETKSQPAFTRFLGSAAIYAINPVDEATAILYAEKLQTKPIDSWDMSEIIKKHNLALIQGKSATKVNDNYEEYRDEDEQDIFPNVPQDEFDMPDGSRNADPNEGLF